MAPATVDPARAAESNLSWILGVLVVFHVIAILFVFLRLYTRIFMVKTFGLDDVLICLSMVSLSFFLSVHKLSLIVSSSMLCGFCCSKSIRQPYWPMRTG
jgi:hypothetical protein